MLSTLRGLKPDITAAQVVGLFVGGVPVAANVLRAFGVYDMSPDQEQALSEAAQYGALVAGALFVSDAGLRAARNAADAKKTVAVLEAPGEPADLDAEDYDGELPSDEEEFAHPPDADPPVRQPSQDL